MSIRLLRQGHQGPCHQDIFGRRHASIGRQTATAAHNESDRKTGRHEIGVKNSGPRPHRAAAVCGAETRSGPPP